MAANVRYLTISRIAFELVTALSAEENLRFNRILFACFRQLESGSAISYEETENPILNIALREAVSELETGFYVYKKRASGGKAGAEGNQCLTNGIPEDNQRPTKDKNDKNDLNRPDKRGKKEPFHPPTVDEVRSYCQERGNGIGAEKFVDYYQARGWELKPGQKMKDWKAAVRTWESNQRGWVNEHGGTDAGGRVQGQRDLYEY